jgi:hypothetical protein
MKRLSLRERLQHYSVPEPNTGCWLWTGSLYPAGYGQLGIGKYRKVTAHRASYETFVGPVPAGLQLDHLCRVRSCINPDHLQPVTLHENLLRGMGPTGTHARQTHCLRGHPLSGDNLYIWPGKDGGHGRTRMCRTCHSQCEARRRARKREVSNASLR